LPWGVGVSLPAHFAGTLNRRLAFAGAWSFLSRQRISFHFLGLRGLRYFRARPPGRARGQQDASASRVRPQEPEREPERDPKRARPEPESVSERERPAPVKESGKKKKRKAMTAEPGTTDVVPGEQKESAQHCDAAHGAHTATIWCVECEDVAASVRCDACGGDYMCGLCFQWQHRSGRRAQHKPVALPGKEMFRENAEGTTQHFILLHQQSKNKAAGGVKDLGAGQGGQVDGAYDGKEADDDGAAVARSHGLAASHLAASSAFIPMRVTPEERVYLRLLEGALQVSEYTDKVDITRGWGWRNSKQDTIREEIGDLLQLLLGLAVAANHKQVCVYKETYKKTYKETC